MPHHSVFFILDKDKTFPGWWALLPTVGALLILEAGPKAFCNRLLSSKVFVWFGLISFPLYLWHWPLLAFLRILGGDRPSSIQRIAAVLIAIFLAWLTYVFIERPIRGKIKSNSIAYFLLFLLMLIGLMGGWYL
jgi:peptidoglycan/LPS O-acetylase OafA/YrhL